MAHGQSIDKIAKSINRYTKVADIIKKDTTAKYLLNDLVTHASKYVAHCANMTSNIRSQMQNESCHYRENMQNLDQTRRIYHTTLIDSLKIFNRHLFKEHKAKAPAAGIYSLEPDTIKIRGAIGDWAGYFVLGLKQLGSGNH